MTHTLTALEVVAVTSVRVCTGVAYLATPGGPLLEVAVGCTTDLNL